MFSWTNRLSTHFVEGGCTCGKHPISHTLPGFRFDSRVGGHRTFWGDGRGVWVGLKREGYGYRWWRWEKSPLVEVEIVMVKLEALTKNRKNVIIFYLCQVTWKQPAPSGSCQICWGCWNPATLSTAPKVSCQEIRKSCLAKMEKDSGGETRPREKHESWIKCPLKTTCSHSSCMFNGKLKENIRKHGNFPTEFFSFVVSKGEEKKENWLFRVLRRMKSHRLWIGISVIQVPYSF